VSGRVIVLRGDAAHLPLPDGSVDSVVTDPPYALAELPVAKVAEALSAWLGGDRGYVPKTGAGGFMGRKWDDFVPPPAAWDECMRVLKPGGYLLAFSAPRTQDLMGMSIRLAGFEIRDGIKWIMGSGFPKSLDVSKAIDKRAEENVDTKRRIAAVAEVIRSHREAKGMTPQQVSLAVVGTPSGACWNWEHQQLPSIEMWPAIKAALSIADEYDALIQGDRTRFVAAERAVVGQDRNWGKPSFSTPNAPNGERHVTVPATDDATRWNGWGTALKPAHEPVIVAQKPAGESAILVEIGSHLNRLECEWLSLAKDAAPSSPPTRPGSPEAKAAFAPGCAAILQEDVRESRTPTGAAAGSSAATVTFRFGSMAETCLNTVTSWKECLAVLSQAMSTSTTATTTGPITDLKTLSSSLSKLTAENMAANHNPGSGLSSFAGAVDALFAAVVLSSRATLMLSADGAATGTTPPSYPAEDAQPSPAHEPIIVARKPMAGTVAANVLTYGTGALNIDGCRTTALTEQEVVRSGKSTNGGVYGDYSSVDWKRDGVKSKGRWPPNVLLTHAPGCVPAGTRKVRGDNRTGGAGRRPRGFANIGAGSGTGEPNGRLHGDAEVESTEGCVPGCPVAEMDRQSGPSVSSSRPRQNTADAHNRTASMGKSSGDWTTGGHDDSGGASRFFPVFRYEAKAGASERPRLPDGTAWPTVKPVALMRWLVRLVTPPGGIVGDFFCGTGPTGEAAIIEGFDAILLDKDPQAIALTRVRLAKPMQPLMPGLDVPDPGERDRTPSVPKPPPVPDGQDSLFDLPGVA
jgi:DNA modification methylase